MKHGLLGVQLADVEEVQQLDNVRAVLVKPSKRQDTANPLTRSNN